MKGLMFWIFLCARRWLKANGKTANLILLLVDELAGNELIAIKKAKRPRTGLA